MGKHHDKVKRALEKRIAATPNKPGFKKPGSMNKKKTGYSKGNLKARSSPRSTRSVLRKPWMASALQLLGPSGLEKGTSELTTFLLSTSGQVRKASP